MPESALAGVVAEVGVAKPDAVIVADGVRRTFGGLVAVDVDHLEIQRGVITSLIGPNGAGKTTLFNCLTRFDRAQAGKWSFDGVALERKLAYQVPRHGLVRTFQLTRTMERLTVEENLLLAAPGNPGERILGAFLPPLWRSFERARMDAVDAQLERFRLDHMRNERAGALSGGQRKLLGMARALMTGPKAILLDEPMAGVNPALRQTLSEHILELRDDGLTVVLIEHDMDVVMNISDWVVCMAQGSVIAEGRPGDILADEAVVDAYLGARHGESATPDAEAEARVVEGPGVTDVSAPTSAQDPDSDSDSDRRTGPGAEDGDE
ncbi:MAG: ABC transporter ATP-binding protein [Acidimicrobiia bacterium]|nr:ABC transporter ATP-binding protein [Acidimicrobiia bacterium]